ncbi:MAG: kynurenine formamidase [bacterium]|nr:kynurenine formamidase [bacterium]
MAELYDISPAIRSSLAVWPGDTPPAREVLLDMRNGDNLTLSTLHSTVHLGSHADAPSHYGAEGETIDARSLGRYLGRCQLIRVAAERGAALGPDVLGGRPAATRVLLATGTYPDPDDFNTDFAALSPELIDRLHECDVRLVGVDTPSVDRFDSKDLPTHRRCLQHDVAILEGLVLEAVPEGIYELIALPLKLVGFDASPVRAVLRAV